VTLHALRRAQFKDSVILFFGTVVGVIFSVGFPPLALAMQTGEFRFRGSWYLVLGSLVVAVWMTLASDRDKTDLPAQPADRRSEIMGAKIRNRRKRFANNFYAGFAWQSAVGQFKNGPREVVAGLHHEPEEFFAWALNAWWPI